MLGIKWLELGQFTPGDEGTLFDIGPSVAVQAVSCSRVTQWPLNSLVFSLSLFVVNLPRQAESKCGQLYTNVYRHSHQI